MRNLWIFALLAASAFSAAAPKSANERMAIIWGSAFARFENQSDAWFDKGEFPKVVNLLRMHSALKPDDYEIATNLGWMLENVENWNEALAVYVRYRKQNPANPDSTFPEANFYFMKKAYAKVPPLLEPSLAKKPQANSYRILAHAYERMQMLHDSKRIWEIYLKRFPNDGAAKVNLKRVNGKIGK